MSTVLRIANAFPAFFPEVRSYCGIFLGKNSHHIEQAWGKSSATRPGYAKGHGPECRKRLSFPAKAVCSLPVLPFQVKASKYGKRSCLCTNRYLKKY